MEYVLGVLASLLVQAIKLRLGSKEYETLGILVGVSVVFAAFFTLFSHLGYWEVIRDILITAGSFYSFIIMRFPDLPKLDKENI